MVNNFITRLEPILHELHKDELVLLYILMGDFEVYSRSTILDINIIDVCGRARITEERYNKIIDNFEKYRLLKRTSKSRIQSIEWVEFCLPTLRHKKIKKKHQIKKMRHKINE